jgi:hypothetical protein
MYVMLVLYSEYLDAYYRGIKDIAAGFICPMHGEIHFEAVYLDVICILCTQLLQSLMQLFVCQSYTSTAFSTSVLH